MSNLPERIADVEDADCTGMQALVTGSTSGIGRHAALALGRLGADVIVHGRDRAAGAAVVDELTALGVDSQFVEADFADTASVRELAATVRAETERLDILANNAGGLFRNDRLTSLGVEYTFHVNHLSPYLLTAELLDHLAPDARIVTTASAAHKGASLNLQRVTEADAGMGAYSHSKLANILFSTELARRLDAAGHDVTANSFHPGAIPGSGFSRFLPGPLPDLFAKLGAVPGVTSVEDGAAALVNLAVSPRLADVSGRYFSGFDPATPSSAGRDTDAAHELWARSAEWLDIEEPLAD